MSHLIALTLVLVAAIAGACAPAPPPLVRTSHPANLVGTTWRVLAVGGQAVPRGSEVTVSFEATRVGGDSGCNLYGGDYRYDGTSGALRIGTLVVTDRACADAGRMALEAALLAGLGGAVDASIDPSGRLILSGTGPALALDVGPTLEPAPS